MADAIDRQEIAAAERLIRAHIRRTPVIETNGADFGLDAVRLSFIVDDNDGNLTNGTPHFRALANAADSRKIPRIPDPPVAGPSVAAAASFPWVPVKVVSANSNILQATIHLDKPGKVHVAANTSARAASPVQFQTGVYNGSATNVVWTDSFRSLSAAAASQWADVSTMFAIDLPAGDHTIYWKIWITGGSLSLSSGVLTLEAFEAAGGPMAITAAATTEATTVGVAMGDAAGASLPASLPSAVPAITTSRDEAGRGITKLMQ